jgi:hypothetical protein
MAACVSARIWIPIIGATVAVAVIGSIVAVIRSIVAVAVAVIGSIVAVAVAVVWIARSNVDAHLCGCGRRYEHHQSKRSSARRPCLTSMRRGALL